MAVYYDAGILSHDEESVIGLLTLEPALRDGLLTLHEKNVQLPCLKRDSVEDEFWQP